MVRICTECPITQMVRQDRPKYNEGIDNGLLMQVLQGLSGKMMGAVKGTKAGLTDERIEEIRLEEMKSWGNKGDPDGEAEYLQTYPELAKAVHDCELRIQMGQCVIHSVQTDNT